jgi:asparagine synthase (glutamine-hydrolysing)
VLDGQAGDELLAGYQHYPYVYLRELAHKRRWREFVHEAWRARDVVVPLIRRRLRDRRQRVDVAGLLQPSFLRRHDPPRDDRVKNDLKLRLLQDFVTYSLPPLLRYEDRISMAHSLEARLPFLDQELVEHILSLPAAAIINNGWNRAVLRQGLGPVLPDKIRRRRKKIGFTTPEFRWFRRQRAALQSLMRSPSFSGRPWWNGPAVAEAFRQACVGEREENMFFWRAINAEVWMRIFIDDQATSLNDHSYASGFAARGDAHVRAALDPADAQGLAASGPNPRRHLFMTSNGGTYARIPLRSPVIDRGDDVADVLAGCLDQLRQQGCEPRDGDLVVISEKALAISQGRGRPVDEIHCTIASKVLSRFVTRSPIGIGLGHPTTMQLAIDEVGLGRILLATAAAGVTRPFGRHGVFYRVAGSQVNAIDGPSHANLPPFDHWAMAAPLDSEGEARRIAAAISDRFGARIDVAIIDANDLTSEVFAITNGFSIPTLRGLVSDNPLGQSAEQTPFGLIRQITEQLPAAATA